VDETDDENFVVYDQGSDHYPKIFLFGATTQPKVITRDGAKHYVEERNGKVALFRIRGVRKRKRNSNGKKKGDPIYENITINGRRYKTIMEMQGGLLDKIEQYYLTDERPTNYSTAHVLAIDLDEEEEDIKNNKPVERWNQVPAEDLASLNIVSQEDGAPGHGHNNRMDADPLCSTRQLCN
jgi:hypothetical protein